MACTKEGKDMDDIMSGISVEESVVVGEESAV